MVQIKPVSAYRKKLFLNFFLLFIVFSFVVAAFQFKREKVSREKQLVNTLDTYIEFIHKYVNSVAIDSLSLETNLNGFVAFLPSQEVRVTMINHNGFVLFDSSVDDVSQMENHLMRPEVREALKKESGSAVRHSTSTNKEYFYYARNYPDYIIRTALPYDISVEKFLRVDSIFFMTLVMIFLLSVLIVFYLSDRMSKSIDKLQEFAVRAAKGDEIDLNYEFPNNELGSIGAEIVKVYIRLQSAKDALNKEREKLFRHLQIAHEGIAIFSAEKKQLLANNHFVQFLNNIVTESAVTPSEFFKVSELKPVVDFIEHRLKDQSPTEEDHSSNILTINKNGRYYVVQAIVFQDRSFEISINDVTKLEKEKKLKQQMTSNIAHELKTPVSSILGYLETILTSKVDKDRRKFFLERSYVQTQRLSSLIQDISLLNKIEEASDLFQLEDIDIRDIVHTAIDDLQDTMEKKKINVEIDIPKKLVVHGSRSVFFSIWRNLIENSVNYAGEGVTLRATNYLSDNKYYYFSYSDNGTGIPESHLARIFERFYRVDSGRSRSMGGTGLGLAIVKNGVIFHKGEISVKNLKGGGVEFIFSIAKDLTKI